MRRTASRRHGQQAWPIYCRSWSLLAATFNKAIGKKDADSCIAPVTIGSLEEHYNERASALQLLDAIQLIEADPERFAASMQELQKRAALAASAIRDGVGPSDEDKKAADQVSAVLAVLNAKEISSGADSHEQRFANLGISDTILLGLVLGKHNRTASSNETAAVRDDALSAAGRVGGTQ